MVSDVKIGYHIRSDRYPCDPVTPVNARRCVKRCAIDTNNRSDDRRDTVRFEDSPINRASSLRRGDKRSKESEK